MKSIKTYFQDKKAGIYFILATFVLALFTLIVFAAGFDISYMSWGAFAFVVVLLVADILLTILKKEEYIPAINAVCSGFAIGFFIYACYGYVATVMTGIDIESFSMGWILSVIGYVGMFVLSVVSIFVPLRKEAVADSAETVKEETK